MNHFEFNSSVKMLHVTLHNSPKNTCQKYIAYLSIFITIPSKEKCVNINSNSNRKPNIKHVINVFYFIAKY